MMDLDRWREIATLLQQHKLRTLLTAFGVFWGIFMLVVLLGMGRSLERGVIATFGGHKNTVFVWSAGPTQIPYRGMGKYRRIRLTEGDRDALLAIPEMGLFTSVNELGGWQASQYIIRGQNSGTFSTRGMEPDGMPIGGFIVQEGRGLNALDYSERRKVAVIGHAVQDILFEKGEQPIGQYLKIAGVNFRVIGVFKSLSTGENAREDAERILIPNSSLRHTYNQTAWIGHFQFTPQPGHDATTLENKVLNLLRERHRVHPDDTGVFGVYNAQVNFHRVQGLFSAIRVFSWVVAIGTIIAGVVGVGNIMLIVVKERTREIGVRKALGASSRQIIGTVVQESLVLTILAGYSGLVAGVFVLEFISSFVTSMSGTDMFGKADIDFGVAVMALAALIISGTLAALLPASKAARVDPIVALQDE